MDKKYEFKNWHPWIAIVIFITGFFFLDWGGLIFGCFCGIVFATLINAKAIRAYSEMHEKGDDDGS